MYEYQTTIMQDFAAIDGLGEVAIKELAEKLSVSRQSISKWEGAQAIPDIQKIIKMADIFGVSTDYLLKDELEPEEVTQKTVTDTDYDDIRKVSMEEANDYLKLTEEIAPRRANMVSLCILHFHR